MAMLRNREEVINTQLAILVSKMGLTADAETIHVHGQHRPDVLFQMRGLRVIIEGKVEDVPGTDQMVFADARKRIQNGLFRFIEDQESNAHGMSRIAGDNRAGACMTFPTLNGRSKERDDGS